MTEFEKKLRDLINMESRENVSNTHDFVLAKYLSNCLENFEDTVNKRDSLKNSV